MGRPYGLQGQLIPQLQLKHGKTHIHGAFWRVIKPLIHKKWSEKCKNPLWHTKKVSKSIITCVKKFKNEFRKRGFDPLPPVVRTAGAFSLACPRLEAKAQRIVSTPQTPFLTNISTVFLANKLRLNCFVAKKCLFSIGNRPFDFLPLPRLVSQLSHLSSVSGGPASVRPPPLGPQKCFKPHRTHKIPHFPHSGSFAPPLRKNGFLFVDHLFVDFGHFGPFWAIFVNWLSIYWQLKPNGVPYLSKSTIYTMRMRE
jgi:hypothetical protein